MPLDPTIYAQFAPKRLSLLDLLQQGQALQQGQQQLQIGNLDLQQKQRTLENADSLRNLARMHDVTTQAGQDAFLQGYAKLDPVSAIPMQQKIALARQENAKALHETALADLQSKKAQIQDLNDFRESQASIMKAAQTRAMKAVDPMQQQQILQAMNQALDANAQVHGHYQQKDPNAPPEQWDMPKLEQKLNESMGLKTQLEEAHKATDEEIKRASLKRQDAAQASTERHQRVMEAQGWGHLALAKQKSAQEAVPGQDAQAYAKAILEGRAAWPKGRDMTDPMKREALRMAIQVDPTLNESTHAQRQQVQKAFTTGKQADSVNALNTAMGHAAELSDLAEALGNGSAITPINWAKNAVKGQLNNTDITAFNTVKKALADETTKVWRATGGSERDVQEALSNLSPNLSKDQLQRNILEFTKLMASKQAALEAQYKKGMGGMAQINLMDDEAKTALAKIQSRNAGKGGAASATSKRLSPQEAAALPSGTHFIGLDGVERVKH